MTDALPTPSPKTGLPLPDLLSLDRSELGELLGGMGLPGYRVDQVLGWLYRRRVARIEEMTNLSKELRERLGAAVRLTALELVQVQGARDATRKFLWRLGDRSLIESVLIPANPALYGEAADRRTLCVSTQVGCAYGCRFCASGLEGWRRNLEPGEIVGQVMAVERHLAGERGPEEPLPAEGERGVDNLVIMGMGEPLANYANLIKALTLLNAAWGGGIGARRITVSTSGLAPQIRKLADEAHQFRLAISLHGATDEVRDTIMPVNRKYPLRELTAACEYYIEKKGKMITLEYILIAGVNDAVAQTIPLARLAKRLHAKVNLIPYNTVEGLRWTRPEEPQQELFLGALERQGVIATLRREKGHDIDAACGQLRLKTEHQEGVGKPEAGALPASA